jgi:mRNA-degrading endonuclease toxin of MazEF toxin-antitoxin module
MKKKEVNLEPGDVVLLSFPGIKQTKVRPAVIMSSPTYNRIRPDLILGLLTSQINAARGLTDHPLQDWSHAQLTRPSAFRAFFVTLPRAVVRLRVGKLTDRDWRSVLEKTKVAFGFTRDQ